MQCCCLKKKNKFGKKTLKQVCFGDFHFLSTSGEGRRYYKSINLENKEIWRKLTGFLFPGINWKMKILTKSKKVANQTVNC